MPPPEPVIAPEAGPIAIDPITPSTATPVPDNPEAFTSNPDVTPVEHLAPGLSTTAQEQSSMEIDTSSQPTTPHPPLHHSPAVVSSETPSASVISAGSAQASPNGPTMGVLNPPMTSEPLSSAQYNTVSANNAVDDAPLLPPVAPTSALTPNLASTPPPTIPAAPQPHVPEPTPVNPPPLADLNPPLEGVQQNANVEVNFNANHDINITLNFFVGPGGNGAMNGNIAQAIFQQIQNAALQVVNLLPATLDPTPAIAAADELDEDMIWDEEPPEPINENFLMPPEIVFLDDGDPQGEDLFGQPADAGGAAQIPAPGPAPQNEPNQVQNGGAGGAGPPLGVGMFGPGVLPFGLGALFGQIANHNVPAPAVPTPAGMGAAPGAKFAF